MKKIIKSVVSFVAVAGMIVLGLAYFSDLTERKESKAKFAEFYEEENIDVLFIGLSDEVEKWLQVFDVMVNGVRYENYVSIGLPKKIDISDSIKEENEIMIEEDSNILSKFEMSVYQYKYIEGLKPTEIAILMNKKTKQIYDALNRIKQKISKNNKKI